MNKLPLLVLGTLFFAMNTTGCREPTAKRSRRSHENSGLSVQRIQPVGTPKERRKRVFDEWFSSGQSQGKGTAGYFATRLNEFVAMHRDMDVQSDRNLYFDSSSIGMFLAQAEQNSERVSKKQTPNNGPTNWTIGTPQDYGRNMVAVDRRTLAGYKEDRIKLQAMMKLHPPTEVENDDTTTGADDDLFDGARQERLSLEYKMAVRWALAHSNCSQGVFSKIHMILVYFTAREMGYHPDLSSVLSFVPTNLGAIQDYCADMDDHKRTEEAKQVNAAFALSDKGDQKT